MRALRKTIQVHAAELRDHGLFEILDSCDSKDMIARLARALVWWPKVFQDVLRLTASFARGTRIEKTFSTYPCTRLK